MGCTGLCVRNCKPKLYRDVPDRVTFAEKACQPLSREVRALRTGRTSALARLASSFDLAVDSFRLKRRSQSHLHRLHVTGLASMPALSTRLRLRPASFSYDLALVQPSDRIVTSEINGSTEPREYYLSRAATGEPGPLLAVSPFVPLALAQHLMTRKRNSAIGSKFLDDRSNSITNMEGALHTFVRLPVASARQRWS